MPSSPRLAPAIFPQCCCHFHAGKHLGCQRKPELEAYHSQRADRSLWIRLLDLSYQVQSKNEKCMLCSTKAMQRTDSHNHTWWSYTEDQICSSRLQEPEFHVWLPACYFLDTPSTVLSSVCPKLIHHLPLPVDGITVPSATLAGYFWVILDSSFSFILSIRSITESCSIYFCDTTWICPLMPLATIPPHCGLSLLPLWQEVPNLFPHSYPTFLLLKPTSNHIMLLPSARHGSPPWSY